MPGPPPKPSALRIIEGGGKLRQQYRRRIAREPVPAPGIGPAPPILSAEQAAKWQELAAAMAPGLLTRADRVMFQAWVVAACAADRALQVFNEHGGSPLMHGADSRDRIVMGAPWREVRRIAELQRALASDFGATPAARTRIEINSPAAKPHDPLARFLNEPPPA